MKGVTEMKVMALIKSDDNIEAGIMPDEDDPGFKHIIIIHQDIRSFAEPL